MFAEKFTFSIFNLVLILLVLLQDQFLAIFINSQGYVYLIDYVGLRLLMLMKIPKATSIWEATFIW